MGRLRLASFVAMIAVWLSFSNEQRFSLAPSEIEVLIGSGIAVVMICAVGNVMALCAADRPREARVG